jgi:PPOX class probable F420-dependent enzyme
MALTKRQADLLLGKNFASVATLRADGSPHVTPVWVDWDGEHVVFNTARGRAKERHLRRDPRVSIVVLDPDDPYRYLSVTGTAELDEVGAREHIDRLSLRYRGSKFPNRPGEQRVIVRIRPEHVDAHGLD